MPATNTGAFQSANGWKDFEVFNRGACREQDRFEYRPCNRVGRHHFFTWGLGPESLPNISIGGAWEEANDADSFGTELFAQSIGETQSCMLRGVVSGRSGEDAGGSDGEIVDDCAASLHQTEGGLRDQERTVEVCREDIVPDRIRKLVDRQVGVSDAGIIDEDIDAEPFPPDCSKKIVDRMGVADVTRMDQDFGRVQFPAEFLECIFIARGEDEIAAFIGQDFRNR